MAFIEALLIGFTLIVCVFGLLFCGAMLFMLWPHIMELFEECVDEWKRRKG